ncbi:MAG: S41 family peptidase [Bacteroidales bacterium]|nr:S41 family peptidase [Bacteroidales bacterium]
MNNKLSTLLPLLLAVTFSLGMLLQKRSTSTQKKLEANNNFKLQEIINLISNEYVDSINIDKISDDILPSLFEKLDPHSIYISPEDYRDMTDPIRGSFEGIGIQFNIQNDTIIIVQVIQGGPSEKLNILPGDRIITVNDSIIAGNGITNEKTIKLLKGPHGTHVKVGIKRSGINDLIYFDITRDYVPISSIDAAYMIDEETGYIALNCFSQNTHKEFLNEMTKLREKGIKNLIVDLRENGGGLLYTAIDLATEFLPYGDTIVFTKGRNTPTDYYTSEGSGTCQDLNLAVLINEYSASASEIFAGAMQDNERGIVVGRRSFGKGVVNEDFPLRDSSVVRLTTKKFYTPSGRCIQKPYNGNLKDYDKELVDRYSHGELNSADSIDFPDSLKFTTRNGKIVYGGGGIMPDIFVAMDTTTYSPEFHKITNSGILYEYAFDFTEKFRHTISSKSPQEAHKWISERIALNDINKFAENHNKYIYKNNIPNEISLIEKITRCYVIRNIFDNNSFSEFYNIDDKTILKAKEQLEKQNNTL